MPQQPYSREEILQALGATEAAVASFFGSLAPEEFILRIEQAWTPAEHLEHLNASVEAVAYGLGIPKLLLRLRFGRAPQPSRSHALVRESYREHLARGEGARGRYVPRREDLSPVEAEARRAQIQARWVAANERLRGALRAWSEDDLDRIRLPHPLLGLLTVREMLFFTLYHNGHHVEAAKRRLPRFATPAPGA